MVELEELVAEVLEHAVPFGGALASLGLPVSFNVGVELGQLAVVLASIAAGC